MRRTPLTHHVFRPEEEHVASGENDIVPPFCGWDQAVEEPGGRCRAISVYRKMKGLAGLRAAGVNLTRLMECRDYTQGIPGTVGEVLLSSCRDDVLCRHTRKG